MIGFIEECENGEWNVEHSLSTSLTSWFWKELQVGGIIRFDKDEMRRVWWCCFHLAKEEVVYEHVQEPRWDLRRKSRQVN